MRSAAKIYGCLYCYNMILVWSGTADISNQIIGWGDVASAAVQYAIVFLPFLAAKCFKKAE